MASLTTELSAKNLCQNDELKPNNERLLRLPYSFDIVRIKYSTSCCWDSAVVGWRTRL